MTDPTYPELHDLLDGRLDDAEADAVRARIEREPALREAWEELRGVQALVRDYGPRGAELEVPDDFLDGVKARMRAETSGSAGTPPETSVSRRRPGRMLRMLTVAYAAAALIVVGLTVGYVLDDAERGAVETETAKTDDDAQAPSLADKELGEKELGDLEVRAPKKTEPHGGLLPPPAADAKDDAEDDDGLARRRERKVRRAQPEPVAGEGLRPRFGAPGGAVPPKLRTPEDTKPAEAAKPKGEPAVAGGKPAGARGRGRPDAGGTAPPPTTPASDQPKAPADKLRDEGKPAARLARLARELREASAEERVYVLEVEDAASARVELAALLGDAAFAKDEAEGRKRTKKGEAPSFRSKARGAGAGSGAGAGGGDAKKDQPAEESKEAPALRLYRVEGLQLGRLLADLGAAGTKKGAPAPKDTRPDAGAGLALLDVLTRELDASALARLEARASSGVWSGRTFEQPPESKRPAKAPAAQPTPSTPPAPGTPTPPAGPARAKSADGAPSTPKQPAADPRTKQPVPSRKAKAKQPVRVRILLLERK